MPLAKLNQKGFTAIEGLLVVVIVGLIGAIGIYVWHSLHQINTSYSTATKVAQSSPIKNTFSVQKTFYSKVPKDLQAAIFAQTQKDTPACINGSQIVGFNGKPDNHTVIYDPSGFATTGIGCDGGAQYLFVKVNGTWQSVDRTQMAFQCAVLKKYSVPTQLLRTAFVNSSNPLECLPSDPYAVLQTY